MKSDLVFSANRRVANRYLLCRLAAKTVRTLHFASANTQDAITDAFVRIGTDPASEQSAEFIAPAVLRTNQPAIQPHYL